jgi:hypothetical protein
VETIAEYYRVYSKYTQLPLLMPIRIMENGTRTITRISVLSQPKLRIKGNIMNPRAKPINAIWMFRIATIKKTRPGSIRDPAVNDIQDAFLTGKIMTPLHGLALRDRRWFSRITQL